MFLFQDTNVIILRFLSVFFRTLQVCVRELQINIHFSMDPAATRSKRTWYEDLHNPTSPTRHLNAITQTKHRASNSSFGNQQWARVAISTPVTFPSISPPPGECPAPSPRLTAAHQLAPQSLQPSTTWAGFPPRNDERASPLQDETQSDWYVTRDGASSSSSSTSSSSSIQPSSI